MSQFPVLLLLFICLAQELPDYWNGFGQVINNNVVREFFNPSLGIDGDAGASEFKTTLVSRRVANGNGLGWLNAEGFENLLALEELEVGIGVIFFGNTLDHTVADVRPRANGIVQIQNFLVVFDYREDTARGQDANDAVISKEACQLASAWHQVVLLVEFSVNLLQRYAAEEVDTCDQAAQAFGDALMKVKVVLMNLLFFARYFGYSYGHISVHKCSVKIEKGGFNHERIITKFESGQSLAAWRKK